MFQLKIQFFYRAKSATVVYVITVTTLAVTLPHVDCFPMQHVPLEPAVTSQLARYEMNKPYSSFFSAPPEKKSKRKNSRIKTFKGKGKELKEKLHFPACLCKTI